jgi:hypothetical protein
VSDDKVDATYHPDIVPSSMRRRLRVIKIFRAYIDAAATMKDSPYAAYLEALRSEVLAALDDEQGGGQ